MEPFKENLIINNSPFPVDIFIKDSQVQDVTSDPHWHDCYEILYMLEGTAEQQINNKGFKAYKNDLIILNEGDIHSTYCNGEENTRILVIKFLPEIIDNSSTKMFESRYIHSFLKYRSDCIHHLTDTMQNSSAVYSLMMGLYNEFTKKDNGYEIYIKGLIYQLIACLVRDGIINVSKPLSSENDIVEMDKLLQYIEKNHNSKINLPTAAKMLNLSESYFSRYFKKVTGRTFKEYLDFVRICEVEKMLLASNLNVSQAAYEAGFCNVSSFNRVFKRVKGYTPGELKRSKTAKK